ncbi:MAG TPA: exodeoxyribonuclease V subunit gamma [Acidimicrobiales bacterium]|nr:exodeoxyribonuclease V subunit gamma [Acidimicrobiales bacterium]
MLHIHRAERADRLAEALGGVLVDPLPDAFAAEVVAVPTRGVERWLSQRLAGRLGASAGGGDGVCANVEFPFPGKLVGQAVARAAGTDPEHDPWAPERSAWPLLDVVEASLDEPWLAPLAAHLGRGGAEAGDDRRGRRLSVVRHVADLFDNYGVHRPAMVRAWMAGDDGHLPPDLAWQAALWRKLRISIGTPSPAERLEGACARLRDEPSVAALPARLALFGLTRLPASYLDVLRALAAGRQIHLFLLHPSPALWKEVAAHPQRAAGVVRRSADATAALPAHPLLRTWGRDAREMQLVLTAGDGFAEEHHPLDAEPTTLLGRLQADVRADRAPPGPGSDTERFVLEPGDRSLQVHSCHGRARQVEVVRDTILRLLADDPTLEPRDVVVMCPDIESFAPLIHATFGLGERDDEGDAGPPDLRVRLADRSLRQTNPVLGVVAELLRLAAARVTASQVIDLASREPVRRRFDLDDDDLARVDDWIAAAGVRWGLDGAHRAAWGLGGVEANTWRAGLDRLLLGVAMDEEGQRLVGGVLPVGDVDSGDIDLAGRLAELVDRLHVAVRRLAGPMPVGQWAAALGSAAEELAATSGADAWQRAQLQAILDDVVTEAGPSAEPLVLAEVEALLADRLRGRPTRANFRTGHLTMCTLVPMRSVPHRVVCLLGLDDGVFPRRSRVDGDDLVQRDPWVGDRDPRGEDRQLLLDALLAATDHLVLTYSGRDERTNALRPPAVPVGELLDVVDRTAVCAGGGPARRAVVTEHPLQPFDVRNFAPGALAPHGPWSFDAVALAGALASAGERVPAPPFLAGPLPPAGADVVALDDLVRFVQHPARAFLRQRLGIFVIGDEDEPADDLPVEPGPLERWAVGQRLLEARLAGGSADACRAAELARGALPPGALAGPFLDAVAADVENILLAAPVTTGEGASVEVAVELGGGRTLVGTVPGVFGHTVRSVFFSRLAAKHRLAAWVRLLAVTAAFPARPFEAVTVGRGEGRKVAVARIAPLGAGAPSRRDTALAQLSILLDLHARGLREPPPLYCNTSAAWAAARRSGEDPRKKALAKWTSDRDDFTAEGDEQEHLLALGGPQAFDRLLDAPPGPTERGPGWAPDEDSRFGRWARRLWDPLLAAEVLS